MKIALTAAVIALILLLTRWLTATFPILGDPVYGVAGGLLVFALICAGFALWERSSEVDSVSPDHWDEP